MLYFTSEKAAGSDVRKTDIKFGFGF